jgi:hypothetical protein
MIQVVVNNLNIDANYIFIVQKEHYDKYNLKYLLNLLAPDCKIVQVESVTEGAACTTLLAKEFIDNDSPLLIANPLLLTDKVAPTFGSVIRIPPPTTEDAK